MKLNFYTNLSDDRVVTKTLDTLRANVSCDVKRDTSIINPTFLVTGGADDYASANYVYCPEFGRYYYITDIVTAGTGMTEIHCRVDVLMSFSSEFLALPAIVARNENQYNLMLDDSEFNLYANPIVITKEFPDGFDSPTYVITAAGKGTPVTP